MLELVSGYGSDPALIEGWRRLPTDVKVASTEALRSLEPVFIESEHDTSDTFLRARAGAHVPPVVSGRPLRVFFLGYTKPRRFSEEQRSFVLALGRQCAQALSRAQLYEVALAGRSRLSRLVERLQDGVVSFNRRIGPAKSARLLTVGTRSRRNGRGGAATRGDSAPLVLRGADRRDRSEPRGRTRSRLFARPAPVQQS
jgi:GAF domain-containing protein